MLAKLTSKNQLTLPKRVFTTVLKTEYFEIEVESDRIVLTPVRVQKANVVREKLAALGISEEDVTDAIKWTRDKN